MKCKHIWIRKVSDSCHWEECTLCKLQRYWDWDRKYYAYIHDEVIGN